jgi:ABC-type multidrug transport system permease subunit
MAAMCTKVLPGRCTAYCITVTYAAISIAASWAYHCSDVTIGTAVIAINVFAAHV